MSVFGNLVARASLLRFNDGLTSASAETMEAALGNPTGLLSLACQNNLASAKAAALMQTRDFGAFRATGIAPALDSLQKVMDAAKAADPALFAAVGSAGMLCVRRRRPTSGAISSLPSNHSWGTAIDITIDGQADTSPDGMVQIGIADLVPIFNAEGWFWGGGFAAEDDTHFEVANETIGAWDVRGFFDPPGATPPSPAATTAAGFDLSSISVTLQPMALKIVDAFAAVGFGKEQQAAALANAMAESGLRADAHSRPPEDSVGLFQLNRGGGLGTGHSTADLEDPDRNIEIIIGVAQKTRSFLNARSLRDAVVAFVRDIERPANAEGEIEKRLATAQQLLHS